MFGGKGLMVVTYNIYKVYESDFVYLAKAMSSKYGAPIAVDIQRFITIMNALGAPMPYEEYMQYAADISFANWELDDGTYVVIAFDGYMLNIAYMNEDRISD